jgi:hypothetical protein
LREAGRDPLNAGRQAVHIDRNMHCGADLDDIEKKCNEAAVPSSHGLGLKGNTADHACGLDPTPELSTLRKLPSQFPFP